jgi:hypothetical protein
VNITARSQKRFYKTSRGNQPKVEIRVWVSATMKPTKGRFPSDEVQTVELTLRHEYKGPRDAAHPHGTWITEGLDLELDPAHARGLANSILSMVRPSKVNGEKVVDCPACDGDGQVFEYEVKKTLKKKEKKS